MLRDKIEKKKTNKEKNLETTIKIMNIKFNIKN